MRAFEPLRDERGKLVERTKAFEAFKTYRDLGPTRTLRKAAESYYGSTANLRQIQEWSRRFDWLERARAFDAWQGMIRREAVEEHERARASEEAERRGRVRRNLLEAAEIMSLQAVGMARWPLQRRETVEVDEKGRPTIVHVFPARWSKRTVLDLVTATSKILEDAEIVEKIEELEELVANQQGGRYGGGGIGLA